MRDFECLCYAWIERVKWHAWLALHAHAAYAAIYAHCMLAPS
jgi:hypothetical protein